MEEAEEIEKAEDKFGHPPVQAGPPVGRGAPQQIGCKSMPDADEAVAADLKHILRLRDIKLKMGGMLVARTSDGPKNTESHCQELSVERLASEPVESPQTLGPFLLYSFLCPCPSCAQKI